MTGISTSGTITFDDNTPGTIKADGLQKGSDVPTVTDEAVYLLDNSSYAYTQYSGSGTLKLVYMNAEGDIGITDTKTGEITSGNVSFTLPDRPSASHLLNVTDVIGAQSAGIGATADDTVEFSESGGFTVSDPDARIALYGSRFIPSGDSDPWYYNLNFASRKRTTTGATEEETSGFIQHIYADRTVTVKGTRTYTWVVTGTGGQYTYINTETYDATLLPGWNILYFTNVSSYNSGTNTGTYTDNVYSDKTKVGLQFDINNWKWALDASFEEMRYEWNTSDTTVSLNIMEWQDGSGVVYPPSDPQCPRWEHESRETFPMAGRWTITGGSGAYMVFPAGTDGTMTFHWSSGNGEFMTYSYSINTANKTMKWKWVD
jgi:hypothetical protein